MYEMQQMYECMYIHLRLTNFLSCQFLSQETMMNSIHPKEDSILIESTPGEHLNTANLRPCCIA
jgi:hypothetical protein